MTWNQPAPVVPTGIMYNYVNMTGAVYLNGSILHQDKSLVEPLTRAWNTPHYWILSAPQLHVGENTLLIRISGLSAFQPGLGTISFGTPKQIEAAYEHEYFIRQTLPLISLTVSATLGCFFIAFWLLRRRETANGWFALMSFSWVCYGFNQIATSPWPFNNNYVFEAFNTAALMVFSGSFALFILRFFNRRMFYFERCMKFYVILGVCVLFLMPNHYLEAGRTIFSVLDGFVILGNCLLFLFLAWQSRQEEHLLLAAFVLITIAADVHDVLVFVNIIPSNMYYATLASNFLLVGMALVLAWRFTGNLKRIENFNNELQLEVNAAKTDLTNTLQRQHELEITHARMNERLNLVRDLHDGLGGTLVGGIAAIETASGEISRQHYANILKEVRDDLRLIIETASSNPLKEVVFLDQLIPLRHRMTMLLDDHDIRCIWRIEGIDQLHLSTTQSLDLLRFIQEALTNVLKHSHASSVDIVLGYDGKVMSLSIVDDGMGMTMTQSGGTGLHSMQARAKRLGSEMHIESRQGRTVIGLTAIAIEPIC